MPTRNPWLFLIILLTGGFLALSGWSFYRAANGASAVTDRDYYRHGLRFNRTLLEQKAAASLGWAAELRLQGRLVTIVLRDREQQAVSGARGSLVLLGAGSEPVRELALREHAPGIYRAEFPAGLHGEQPAEITFQRDGARLNRRLLFSLN